MGLNLHQKNALELKLRRCQGADLQKFLAEVLTRAYGDNFQSTSTDYSQGDLKCDGLFLDPLTIFACYGPVNAGAHVKDTSMRAVVEKIRSDFVGAVAHWNDMKSWVFVTNFPDIPVQISHEILELKKKNPSIEIVLFGRSRFESEIGQLDGDEIEELIGRAATAADFYSVTPQELRDVLAGVYDGLRDVRPTEEAIKPVPAGKLEFNGLTSDDRGMILNGLKRTRDVREILENAFGDPQAPSILASNFRDRYLGLEAQKLPPGEILGDLFAFVMAEHSPTPRRQASVYCILAFLFEHCSIFKDEPVEARA